MRKLLSHLQDKTLVELQFYVIHGVSVFAVQKSICIKRTAVVTGVAVVLMDHSLAVLALLPAPLSTIEDVP